MNFFQRKVLAQKKRRQDTHPALINALFPRHFEQKVQETKESAFDNARSFGKALEKKGWKWIGRGFYSSVYAKEGSKRVLKVGHRPESDGWVDYVLWANRSGYGGSFAPKVYSYKWIKGKESDFYLASMERLHATWHHVDKYAAVAPVGAIWPFVVNGNENAKIMADLFIPGLAKFSEDFLKEFERGHDMHAGNYMLRANDPVGFVLTDPLSNPGRETPITERIRFH